MDLPRYDPIAAGFHWLAALLVIALIVLGIGGKAVGEPLGMSGMETIFLHKSLGMTVFAITVLRLLWRFGHHPPPLPANTPAWQRRASRWAHLLLYTLMLALPVLGYLLSSAGPYPLEWFGTPLPKLPVSKEMGEVAASAHVAGGLTMAALVVLHIAAALWHQFVQRDRLIGRMRIG
ncbi:MAG: cytochrome b [Candidatus Andeanibacterium colombiense]|uniref:Cytochrome b n=1 Tax=Candidatus Andeanibacterium colombiense TaxID=3121345 RepID=A0AAJ6BPD3_9SPHN|nr:MAG: cytochrome b [Sphingomonadaceae bacterium]